MALSARPNGLLAFPGTHGLKKTCVTNFKLEGDLHRNSGYRNEALFRGDASSGRPRALRILPTLKKRAERVARQWMPLEEPVDDEQSQAPAQLTLFDGLC